MIDLTSRSASEKEFAPSDRPSFRRRLLTTVGPALAAALLFLGLLAWGAAYVALQRSAVEVLQAEADEVEADIVRADGTLQVDGHTWSEVHHRLAAERVDPVFLQVFDRYNRALRVSANVDSLSALYPEQPLALNTSYHWIPTLRTIEVDNRTLYYLVRPLTHEGRTLGYIQVARAVPNYRGVLTTFGAALGGIIVLLFGGLLLLVSWAATRVLHPLRRITAVAENMTSADLDERVDVPNTADRETALLAHTFNDLLDRLEDSFDALRTFTANAAHELQTPLTVLQGHVEIALRRSRSADSYESTLRLLDRKLGTLVRTVRALLTLTRLDRGDTLSTEPVALGPLVQDEIKPARSAAEDKGLSLIVATDDVWVSGQADLLREAVQNLVDNAVKYTEDGTVQLSVAEEDGRAVVRCRDTGMGIAAEDLPHVGARFYRSADAGTTTSDGSGLGLALVRRIVAAHNGELRVDSTPGKGTTFEILLSSISPPDETERVVSAEASQAPVRP
jgi:signal transduction histidine kinase